MFRILAWLACNIMGPHIRLYGDARYGGVHDFVVYEENGGLVFDAGTQPGCGGSSTDFVPLRALVVPQVMASDRTLQATAVDPSLQPPSRYLIPREADNGHQGYYSFDLPRGQRPQGVTVILTPQFTGCAFAIAVANNQVHMAHIQPRPPPNDGERVYDPMADRQSVVVTVAA